MNETVYKRTLKVVEQISGRKIDHIDPDGEIKEQLTLDSIQLVELFAALEIEFKVDLPLGMMSLVNAGEFLEQLHNVVNNGTN
ncbi:hypothetical protein JW960_24735 [candidate division KSB1 bacterium]|nr:hypothetical protein [candidate division KSB1 bacterium]